MGNGLFEVFLGDYVPGGFFLQPASHTPEALEVSRCDLDLKK